MSSSVLMADILKIEEIAASGFLNGHKLEKVVDLLVTTFSRCPKDMVTEIVERVHDTYSIDDMAAVAAGDGQKDLAKDQQVPVTKESFFCYLPMHRYLYRPTGQLWPATSVNSSVPPVMFRDADGDPILDKDGNPMLVKASVWIDQERPVQQMTWFPGEPELIHDSLIVEGGWIDHPGATVYNLYKAPRIQPGDPARVLPWVTLLKRVYPDDHQHITRWLAHRIQRPHEKINHALVLGGAQGIGKDTLLEACIQGIGPWNSREVSPHALVGRFNPFVKSVVLRVSEARDLGELNRFAFYEATKVYAAAPPDLLRVDQKNVQEYAVPNLVGLVITTNNRDSLYLPADDRRHYVAWSMVTKGDFKETFWRRFWRWYQRGGVWNVVAYLQRLDLRDFDPKAPPPKTDAFWQFVESNRAPEDAELADALEELGNPDAVTVGQIADAALSEGFKIWLGERRNAWAIRKRINQAGYVSVTNRDTKDGVWKIAGRRQAVYAREELSERDRIGAAQKLAEELRPWT